MNFIALAVIADFDDFFYSAMIREKYQDFADGGDFADFFKIDRTSSKGAAAQIEEHKLKVDKWVENHTCVELPKE